MLEKIEFALYRAFGIVMCNPEFWLYQYVPILIGMWN